MIMGRTFAGHILDMFEFGIENFKGSDAFAHPIHIQAEIKPVLVFQGEPFEVSEKHNRLKNYFIDFFKLTDMSECNIVEMRRAIVFTCKSETDPIVFQHLECHPVSEPMVHKNKQAFREIGPSFSLRFRRDKIASSDLYKNACKQPKVLNSEKKKFNKNKFTNELGQEKAKVFVTNQELDTLATRKFFKGKK